MPEDPQSSSITRLTRDKLYEEVWKTPMIRLAAEFGLSDNGLRKICKRLDVPCPPAGWWAKKAAGKKVSAAALPPPRPGTPLQATITPTPDDTSDLRQMVRREADRIGRVDVPDRLMRPHVVIAGWIEHHRTRQEEARQRRRSYPLSNHRVPDFSETDRRRHRVLNALFRDLEKHGGTIIEDDRRHLVAELGGEKIEFSCHEKSKQTFRPMTDDEKRWRSDRDRLVQELQPTGRLEFQIRAWIDQPIRKVWLESDRQSLETKLTEIAATFLVLAPLLAERTRKRQEQQRLWKEQQRQRELEQQRKQQDDNRWKRFLQLAEASKQSELAREFIARLRKIELPQSELIDGWKVGEWLDWAEAKAGERDPLGQGVGPIFSDVSQISAWTRFD